jgi:hypothetical protein
MNQGGGNPSGNKSIGPTGASGPVFPLLSLVALGVVVVLSVVSWTSAGDGTVVDGDWNITSDTTLRDGSWIVNGSMTVSGCTLTLDHAEVTFGSTSPESNRIIVTETGRLVSLDSTVTGADAGTCIEVQGDTLLVNTTVSNVDRDYRGCGIYHTSGDLRLIGCAFQYGPVLISSQSNLTVESCTFSEFDQYGIDWRVRGVAGRKVVVVEGSTFQNRRVVGRAISIEGPRYERVVSATVANNTFRNVDVCVDCYEFYSAGYEVNGVVLIRNNSASGCQNGMRLDGGGAITARDNVWGIRYHASSSNVACNVRVWGEGSPSLSQEVIEGGATGMYFASLDRTIEVVNVSITGVDVGIQVVAMEVTLRDSVIESRVHDVESFTGSSVRLLRCHHDHRSWVFGSGEVLELVGVNITSVTWQEGTPIDRGTVVIQTEDGYVLGVRDSSAPVPLLLPTWVLRETTELRIERAVGVHGQGNATFQSMPFTLEWNDDLKLVILDRLPPRLEVVSPVEHARFRVDSLVVTGSVVERGAGEGGRRPRCPGMEGGTSSCTTWGRGPAPSS